MFIYYVQYKDSEDKVGTWQWLFAVKCHVGQNRGEMNSLYYCIKV